MNQYQFNPQNSVHPSEKTFFDGNNAVNPTQATKTDARSMIEKIFSYQPPKPVYDENRPEEIQRRMRLNSIGNGMKLLGDMFSISKNGNVVRREPDRTNDELQNYIYAYQDKINQMDQDWNYQEFANNMKKGLTLLDQDNKDKVFDTQRADRADDVAFRNKSFDAQQADRDKQRKHQDEVFEWQKKTPYIQHDLRMKEYDAKMAGEMAKYAAKAQYNGKNFVLYDDKRTPITQLDQGEMEKIVQLILKDPAVSSLANKDIGLMKAQFGEGLSKQSIQTIVGYYWDKSPEVRKYLGIDGSEESPAQVTTPGSVQDVVEQKKIDYKNLIF